MEINEKYNTGNNEMGSNDSLISLSSKLSRKERLQKIRIFNSAILIQSNWRRHIIHSQYKTKLLKNNIDNQEEKIIEIAAEEKMMDEIETENNLIKEDNHHFVWPTCLKDNFDIDNRPNLQVDDELVEKWVIDNKKILVRTLTWNLMARLPPPAPDNQDDPFGLNILPRNKFHLYIIGTEECERSIAQSTVNTSKKNWEDRLKSALGPLYIPISAHTLQATHIIAFAHKSISHLIYNVGSGAVACGMGNTLGNKGGVCVTFSIGSTKLAFVNAHLAAHQNHVKERNSDYNKIMKELPSILIKSILNNSQKYIEINKIEKDKEIIINNNSNNDNISNNSSNNISNNSSNNKSNNNNNDNMSNNKSNNNNHLSNLAEETANNIHNNNQIDSLSNQFLLDKYVDRLIFMGDLNYRLRGNRSLINRLLELNMHDVLLNNDQLIWSKKSSLIFNNFIEPPLNFRPTYKFDIDSDNYDTGPKQRLPAWTDRILYTPNGINCTCYESDNQIRTSDHRPVFASFDINIDMNQDHIDSCRENGRNSHSDFESKSQVCTIM